MWSETQTHKTTLLSYLCRILAAIFFNKKWTKETSRDGQSADDDFHQSLRFRQSYGKILLSSKKKY